MKKKKGNRETYLRIFELIKPYWYLIALSLVFALVSVALTLYAPVLTGQGIDLIIGKGNVDFDGLVPILIRFAIVVGITAAAQWLMNLCNNRVTYHVIKDIRVQAFNHLEELPLKYIDGHQHGDIISRVVTDVDQFSDGLLLGFSQIFTGVVTILGTLIFMLTINLSITLVVVIITPVSLFTAGFIAKRTFSMFQEQSKTRGEITSLVNEMVGNQKTVKAFSHEEEAQEQFDEINERLRDCSLRATFFSSLTNPTTRFVNGLVYTGVALSGALIALRGGITVGQLTCFLSYANRYTKPFNEISGVVTEFQNAVASAARVFELIDEEPQVAEDAGAVVLTPQMADGRVELENVAFSYSPDTPLIDSLNLSIRPGERVAIVGPTGCGKTTIINLLMRFYDVDSGEIRVADIPIRHMTRDSLRTNYGMVLQETWLKSGTIADNIAYGRPDASREEIIEAARSAHAHSFIERMPESGSP